MRTTDEYRDVFLPKNYARQELDKRRLGEVVDLFTNVKMAQAGCTRDILGRTYEYCLTKFAEKEGKNAGEFYTPTCIVKTLVEIIRPFAGRAYEKLTSALIRLPHVPLLGVVLWVLGCRIA